MDPLPGIMPCVYATIISTTADHLTIIAAAPPLCITTMTVLHKLFSIDKKVIPNPS